jgi:hypothetical protein
MLATEVQLREEKKAAIEKATQEYGEELSNQPVGQDAEANKILAEFADSAQELRLMQDRLLRSGSIKLKDYNMMRQNTTSGTGNMFDFADEYNEQFELFKKRLDGLGPTGKKSSEIEAWRVKKLGTFATFRNTKPTFNPATGELSLSEMVDDGNGQMVPKEGLSFSSLRNMLYEQTDQFEVLPAAQKISDSFAKTFKIVDPDGKLLTIDDIKQKPDYEETLSAFVNAELEGNPNAAASILVDYLRYSMDDIDMQWNEEQQTYVPNLTPKQEEEAAGALKQAVEATFQRVETPKPRISSGSGAAARIKAKEKAQEAVEDLTRIMEVFDPSLAGASTAEEAQKARQVALQTLAGAKGWKNIVFEKQPNNVIQVIGKNPENQTKKIGIMDPNTTEGMVNWIDQISQSLGLGNMAQARIDAGFDATKKYILTNNFSTEEQDERTFTFDLTSERGKEKRQKTITSFTNALKKNVLNNEGVIEDAPMMEKDFIRKIQTPTLTDLGIKLEGTGQWDEYIKVLATNKKGKWEEVISERQINNSQDMANQLMNDIFEIARNRALTNNDAGLKAWKRKTTVPD